MCTPLFGWKNYKQTKTYQTCIARNFHPISNDEDILEDKNKYAL